MKDLFDDFVYEPEKIIYFGGKKGIENLNLLVLKYDSEGAEEMGIDSEKLYVQLVKKYFETKRLCSSLGLEKEVLSHYCYWDTFDNLRDRVDKFFKENIENISEE